MPVNGVPVGSLKPRAATSHTSPTALRSLVSEIAELKDGKRMIDARLRNLGVLSSELRNRAAGDPDAADELRAVRDEIRALERRRKADMATLAHKEEQLAAVRKGYEPNAVDDDARRRVEEAEAESNPFARLPTTDLSRLNEG